MRVWRIKSDKQTRHGQIIRPRDLGLENTRQLVKLKSKSTFRRR